MAIAGDWGERLAMARRNLAWVLGILGVTVLAFAVGQSAPTRDRDRDYELVRLVVDVLQEVRTRYVRELSPDEQRRLVETMVNGGLERLDPHSAFINPEEYKQFSRQTKGIFGGVGLSLGVDPQKGNVLTVVSPIVGTPAHEAGILAGDIILKVDGKSTETLGMNESIDAIQGEPGTPVTLTILHEGEKDPVDITVKRAVVKVPSVLGDRRLPDGSWDYMIDKERKIGYIRLSTFSETAPSEMKEALTTLNQQGMTGLILDLRGNPGGLIRAAVEIADMFLDQGRIVSTKGRVAQEEVFEATGPGTILQPAREHPITVIINRYSASASEILAAALQDHARAVVVGERSFGKGSVQNVIEMESRASALKLTTASYWRPSGKNIHRFPDSKETDDWGVSPDKGYAVKLEDKERINYLRWRNDRDVVRKADQPARKPVLPDFKDTVLEKALETTRAKLQAHG